VYSVWLRAGRPGDRGSIPAKAKEFFLYLLCPDWLWAHPASCTMSTNGSFPGTKARPGRDADHSPHLVPRSRMSRSYMYPLPPPSAFVACSGIALGFSLVEMCYLEMITEVMGKHDSLLVASLQIPFTDFSSVKSDVTLPLWFILCNICSRRDVLILRAGTRSALRSLMRPHGHAARQIGLQRVAQ
jgi:hypothetical protein